MASESSVQQLLARVAALVLTLAACVAPCLEAQTSATYTVGAYPDGIAFDGTNIWVANWGDNSVTKLRASTGATLGTYAVGVHPDAVVFDGANIWVVNAYDKTVTKLLASTGASVGTSPVGANPVALVFDGVNIWVTNSGSGTVTKILASTGTVAGTYPAGRTPEGIAFDGVNIWVADEGDFTVTKILASTGATVGNYTVGAGVDGLGDEPPFGVVFDGTCIWVTSLEGTTVTKILVSTGATVGTYAAGVWPYSVVFDGLNVWIADQIGNNVTKLLASTGALLGTYPVGTNPAAMVFDGVNIWVANNGDNTVTKIGPASLPIPSISSGGVVPIYNTSNTIQPGEWVSIYGSSLATAPVTWNGDFPTKLGGTTVTINGKAAYLWFVSSTQINLQAPDDNATGPVSVVVTTPVGTAASMVTLAPFAPSFSVLDGKHVTGIILRSNGSGAYGGGTYDIIGPTGNSLSYPTVAAKAGDSVVLFAVGLGPTNTVVHAGQVFSGSAPTTNSVSLLINNMNVLPTYSGLTSAGLYQLNLTVPAGLGTGDVSLRATVRGVQAQSGIVISLQ